MKMDAREHPKKNIVVLGAGFGGLAAALRLGRALKDDARLQGAYTIILVDKNESHTFTPGLYEAATTAREDVSPLRLKHTAAVSLEETLVGLPVRFVQDEVRSIDVRHKTAELRDSGTLTAEYLVIALGAVTNDFGVPGVLEYGLMLKSFEDALRIRSRTEEALRKNPEAHIVIAGGGATGVELSGELFGMAKRIRGLMHQVGKPRITLIEASGRLLPGISENVARIAQSRLQKLGVNVRLNYRITSVLKNEAVVRSNNKEERVPYDIFIWSGGIKPPALLENITAPKDAKGRCLIGPDLTVQFDHSIFAVGDLTCFGDAEHGRPLPATAYIAIDEGKLAAQNILAHINNRPFSYYEPPKRPPVIVPVSGKWAVAHVFGVTFSGFPAFLLRLVVDLRYFLSVLPLFRALRFFVRSTLVYFRND